jgi:hypothetical protein
MNYNEREDLLKGLERFRSIAKQDILASAHTSNPEFWAKQAEARRSQYDQLVESIEKSGIDDTVELARKLYSQLPNLTDVPEFESPDIRGYKSALEAFFTAVGISIN